MPGLTASSSPEARLLHYVREVYGFYKYLGILAQSCATFATGFDTLAQPCATFIMGFGTLAQCCATFAMGFDILAQRCATFTNGFGIPAQTCAALTTGPGALAQPCATAYGNILLRRSFSMTKKQLIIHNCFIHLRLFSYQP
ncbi:MAG: hypothetical protein LBV26_05465 [Bacteroidales bacterium]|jgi:hypothetical protein|nr:hypothetical protein [Bacteroidales bacterium]